jgi:hypothetical protein
MHLKALLLLSLAVSACGPSPPDERTLLLEVDDNAFFAGLRIYRDEARLLYTFDDHEEFKIAATLTPAGERELAELLAVATRDSEFSPCPDECGFLGCPGTWTLHNTDAAGGFEVGFCGTLHVERPAEFEDALKVLFLPLECKSNEFVEVEAPCPP